MLEHQIWSQEDFEDIVELNKNLKPGHDVITLVAGWEAEAIGARWCQARDLGPVHSAFILALGPLSTSASLRDHG